MLKNMFDIVNIKKAKQNFKKVYLFILPQGTKKIQRLQRFFLGKDISEEINY